MVAFANGTRFAEDHGKNQRGLEAYELWQKAFESNDISPEPSRYHTEILRGRRHAAASYIRGLITTFPKAKKYLEEAAVFYDKESEILNHLHGHCSIAQERGAFTSDERTQAKSLITEALKLEEMAIASIKLALDMIEDI